MIMEVIKSRLCGGADGLLMFFCTLFIKNIQKTIDNAVKG